MSDASVAQRGERSASKTKTFRIPVSTGIFQHYQKVGDAVWLLLWLIDATTEERDGFGIVRGANPLSSSYIAGSFGCSPKTVDRWRATLAKAGYISVKRKQAGYVYQVKKSKKWTWKRSDKNVQSDPRVIPQIEESDSPKREIRFPESGNQISRNEESLNRSTKQNTTNKTAQHSTSTAAAAFDDESFQQAKQTYHQITGKPFGSLGGKNTQAWENLVSQRGRDSVLGGVKAWTENLTPDEVVRFRSPVAVFLSQAEQYIDAAKTDGDEEAQSAQHQAENQRRFDAAVEKHGAENVKWNDSPFDSARVMVNVGGDWVPPEIAESVRLRQEEDARKREERQTKDREAEIDRCFDEEMTAKYADDWTHARLRPTEEFNRECEELRRRIGQEIAGRDD